MQRMEESRSRDPGTKGKRERIADTPFIAIGSERLFPPPTPPPCKVVKREYDISIGALIGARPCFPYDDYAYDQQDSTLLSRGYDTYFFFP